MEASFSETECKNKELADGKSFDIFGLFMTKSSMECVHQLYGRSGLEWDPTQFPTLIVDLTLPKSQFEQHDQD